MTEKLEQINFLIEKLKDLHNKFDNIEIRYEYREKTKSHIIEIKPFELYNDIEYIDSEIIIENEFEKLFPEENIIFISDKSLTCIEEDKIIFKK